MTVRRRAAALAALLSAALAGSAAAQDLSAVQVESTKLADGVWMLKGAGGNIGVSAGADGIVVIDDQYAPLAPKILAALRAISDKPLRFVLNTHWHGDHTGGNEALGAAGALIVAHHNVRRRLAAGGFMEAFKRDVPPAAAGALPVVTFGDDVSFHLNGDELRAYHVEAAHTDGDAIVRFERANVIHAGDIWFNGLYPVIDYGSGGHIRGMVAAVDRIAALADAQTKIIPGHGPVADRAALLAYRDMLATVAERMEKLVRGGATLEQVQAAKPTAEFDAAWGNGFLNPQAWVEMVYHGVVRQAAPAAATPASAPATPAAPASAPAP